VHHLVSRFVGFLLAFSWSHRQDGIILSGRHKVTPTIQQNWGGQIVEQAKKETPGHFLPVVW
jgi:hypothetical protein